MTRTGTSADSRSIAPSTAKAVNQWTVGKVSMFFLMSLCATCHAQLAQDSKTKNDLLEGVLDLVTEPKESNSDQPKLTPEEVGLGGENLGEQTSNPLQAVRQSMLIAAGFMQKGAAGSSTQQLQADIVVRLDELIEQLEKSPQDQQQSQSEQNSADQQSRDQGGEPSGEEVEGQQSGEQPSDATEPGKMQQSDSGNTGETADTEVELAKSRALQMDVWGMLPDSVRAQMQSQMVEQFLPSHREKIEAYFRALLKQTK